MKYLPRFSDLISATVRLAAILLVLQLADVVGRAQTAAPVPPNQVPPQQLAAQVDRLLSQMTLEEKILQLLAYQPNGVPR